jgi:arsenical pump membrane protein
VARWGGGSGTRLFVFIVLLGAVAAAFFANDGAVLILTPLVLEMLHALRYPPRAMLAFIMAVGFISDAASLPFKISNLTNIISANYFGISFGAYAEVMGVVNLVSVAASLLVLGWVFRRDIPARFDPCALAAPASAIRDRFVFITGWVVLAGVLAGYFLARPLGLPTAAVAGSGALLLVLAAAREHFLARQPKAVIPVLTLMREAPWQVVIFSLGMYLVVYGLRNQGLTAELARGLEWLAHLGFYGATLASGFLFALMSSLVNNLPSILIANLAIHEAVLDPPLREAMIYANVIGSDLGPKMTPIGSLATLLWLHVLSQRGLHIGWGEYCRIGILLTLPVLLATLSALVLWLMYLRAW